MARNITFPPDAQQIMDVTQSPYNCDPTGQEDCTEALVRALDDAVRPWRDAFKEQAAFYRQNPFEYEGLFEARKPHGMIFLPVPAPAKTLYFPRGTYLVSDTLRYTLRDLQNCNDFELPQLIQFQGESEKGSVIKLADNCPGFEFGTQRPVIDIMGGISTNAAFHNSVEDLTIDVGAGNPGAVGLVFFANNTGAVRHVTLRSSDPEGAGHCGFSIRNRNASGICVRDVTVEGFDCGVRIEHDRLATGLEHIRVSGQRNCGVHVDRHNVSLRGLVSRNAVPALKVTGRDAVVAFIDSRLEGGSASEPAVVLGEGYLFARNIETDGYRCALSRLGITEVDGDRIEEYVSSTVTVLFPEESRRSLDLPVEEAPEIPWENDHSKWACVNDFGAVGDGETDDTEAIRAAIASGKPVVWFQPGIYLIDDVIDLPPTLRRLNFMKGDLGAGENLRLMHGKGAFRVVGDSDAPLIIEDLFAMEKWRGGHALVDHASRRTLVLSDIHMHFCAAYRNSVEGGKVFIENVFAMNQFRPEVPVFHFKGQQVWARQINPERNDPEILNDGGRLWILGFKTEHEGTAFRTVNGGRTEVLGGTFNQCVEEGAPAMIVNHDSDVSVVCGTTDWRNTEGRGRVMVDERREGTTRQIKWSEFPPRTGNRIAVPLYVGRASSISSDAAAEKQER
ncbi:MAG: glycosyl hydrolase family 28-related protein [Candidatus Brocadiia bacterium]